MKTNGVSFNHAAKEIIITKAFEKAANKIGSTEYNELVKIRRDFPDYTIRRKEIAKKDNKKSFKGLTVEEMRRFLSTIGEADVKLFEKVCEIAEGKQGKYAVIKKWFLNNYKEAYEKADIVVFLVNHNEFAELNYRNDVKVLDFCGTFKK